MTHGGNLKVELHKSYMRLAASQLGFTNSHRIIADSTKTFPCFGLISRQPLLCLWASGLREKQNCARRSRRVLRFQGTAQIAKRRARS
jgi:hypothetical protein